MKNNFSAQPNSADFHKQQKNVESFTEKKVQHSISTKCYTSLKNLGILPNFKRKAENVWLLGIFAVKDESNKRMYIARISESQFGISNFPSLSPTMQAANKVVKFFDEDSISARNPHNNSIYFQALWAGRVMLYKLKMLFIRSICPPSPHTPPLDDDMLTVVECYE